MEARPSMARERMLLHWINSLPVTSCLLVDSLDELRLGDVLNAIVAWLCHDTSENISLDDHRTNVARAVEFAAQRCTTADGDVMSVLNSSQCVAHVLDGDVTAIVAVVTVLKRLTREKEEQDHAQSRAIRQRASRAIQDRDNRMTVGEVPPPKDSVSSKNLIQLPRRVAIPSVSPPTSLPVGMHQNENVRNRSRRSSQAVPTGNTDKALVGEVLVWMASLGVVAPASTLDDGVALCQLAAAIARRRGSIVVRHGLHSLPQLPRGVMFPRGATLQPRTKAEKRHNIHVAWALLKECHILPDTAMDLTPDAVIEAVETNNKSMWQILCHIQSRLRQPVASESKPRRKTVLLNDSVPQRRPYITSEQIDAVKRWMKAQGVDPMTVSSGILDDGLRNGVTLCQLLCQTKSIHFSRSQYKDPPKTLLEVRANLHSAMAAMVSLSEPSIPSVYLTKQAAEAIATGGKQCIYGLLWHVMQFCQDYDARTSTDSARVFESTPRIPETLPPTIKEPVRVKPPDPVPRCESKVTSLLLDVPAIQLVEDEYREGECVLFDGVRLTAWDATSLLDGVDDIMPTANVRPVFVTHNNDTNDDIVPTQRLDVGVPVEDDGDQSVHQLQQSGSVVMQDRKGKAEPIPPPVPSKIETTRVDASTIPRNVGHESTKLGGNTIPDLHPAEETAMAAKDPAPPRSNIEITAVQVQHIVQWLRQLGIELQDAEAFQNANTPLQQFSSGVVLCTIVEKLEHMRRMEGVCRQAQLTKANALHNIDKALQVLQQKNRLPRPLLRKKLKIYEGDRTTILTLLLHMRKAYGHHVRSQLS